MLSYRQSEVMTGLRKQSETEDGERRRDKEMLHGNKGGEGLSCKKKGGETY